MHPQVELLIQFAIFFAVALPISVIVGSIIIAWAIRQASGK